MGCQVRRELWLVDLLGKLRRGREREEPSPCPRLVPPASALTRWLEVVVPPGSGGLVVPRNLGAIGLRSGWGRLFHRKPGGHSKPRKGRGAGARAPGPPGQPGSRRWRPLSRAQGAAAVSLAQRQKLHPAWAHGTWFPTRLGLWWAARFALLSRPPRALPGEGAHPRIPILSARLVHDIKARTMETRVRCERFLWGVHPGVGHNLHVFAGKKDGRGTVSQLLARISRCEHTHREFPARCPVQPHSP